MRDEAVVKDTSAPVGRELPKEAVLAPKGQVNATIKWEVNEPNNIGTAYFLDEGETMRVPEGKAYYIKGRDSWYGAQFYEPGTMIGPVVYAEGENRKPTEVYKSLGGDSGFGYFIFGWILTVPLIVLFAAMHHSQSGLPAGAETWTPFQVVAATLVSVFFFLVGAGGLKETWESRSKDDCAIQKLKMIESRNSPYIPCGNIDMPMDEITA